MTQEKWGEKVTDRNRLRTLHHASGRRGRSGVSISESAPCHSHCFTGERLTYERITKVMPSAKPTVGVNDLKSQFPEIAAEAFGWDPASVTIGSSQKKKWKCPQGHIFDALIKSRTSRSDGCPYCSGRKPIVGINDLKTLHPEIAAEAYGWDPTAVTSRSNQRKEWECRLGHRYAATVHKRTSRGQGCPICSGRKVLPGFNDLQTKYPNIAAEASGWDPTSVSPGQDQKMTWKCSAGHKWISTISSRTLGGNGCPICSGRKVLPGFNDLQTKYPNIAAEASGWDPSEVSAGSGQRKKWRCSHGHEWISIVSHRTTNASGCPVCCGQKLLSGFNDLKTRFPDIASEAHGWDPSTVAAGTHQRRAWKCNAGHIWDAVVASRVSGSGCPCCAEYGFNPDKKAWFYLMQRAGEQQIGITNDLPTRLKTHERNGWTLMETVGPAHGKGVAETEKLFKRWLKSNVQLVAGSTENWNTASMSIETLAELKAKSGIETDLF